MITLLTDFGVADTYVAQVKGAILSVAPASRVVDITHAVPPQDVVGGAFLLWTAVEAFPAGSIHVAVVDPGVGSPRRGIALRSARGDVLVGPDNGLLIPAANRLGGIALAVSLDRSEFWRKDASSTFHGRSISIPSSSTFHDRDVFGPASSTFHSRDVFGPASSTFHGRDIFGPVAAHLANGVPLSELGPTASDLVQLAFPEPDGPRGEVIHVDTYGNLVTNLSAARLPPRFQVRIGSRLVQRADFYAAVPPGELLALVGSAGLLEISARNASAAAQTNAHRGTPVTIEPL